MLKRLITIADLFLIANLLVGCSSKVRYPNYYSLAIAPTATAAAANTNQSASVAVRHFETPAYLRQGRIVYRQSPEEVGFYDYHRWAADPGAVVTTAMIDSLRSANLFSAVEPYDGQDRPEYILSGRLERLDEVDYDKHVQAEVKLSAQLLNVRTGATVWTGTVTESSAVETRDVNAVVVAMSRAAQGGVDQLVRNMEKQMNEPAMAGKSGDLTAAQVNRK